MINNKIIKCIFSVVIILACLFLFQTISHAASFSASISKTTVTVGDTFSVTVKASNAAGMYSITNSNSNVSLSSGSKSEFLENGSTTVKFKAVKAGTVTITAKSVDMTDLDNSSKTVSGSKTFNVTIKEKSSSSSGSSSASSDTTTTKPTFTSTNKTVYATGNINLRSSWSTSSSATPVSKGTEMTLTGTSSKTVNGYVWYRVSYNGTTKYVSSSLVTTTKPTTTTDDKKDDSDAENDNKNTDNKAGSVNLKSLTVTPTGLSPAFSTGTTEYTMTVGSNIDEIDVKAVAEDEKASVDITGNTNLKIGTNKITITVTASDKTTKIYHITVTKEDKKLLQLSELLVEGLPLKPEFDSNIYEYTLTLDSSDVSEINITATPTKESAEVEIVGNTDLQPGENVVTILVKSANGEEIATYQITVTLPEAAEAVQDNKQSMYVYIGISAAVLVVFIILVIVIIRKHRHQEDNMYYGMYNSKDGKDEEKINNEVERISSEEETADIDLKKLPKLDEEDLPKSLRKNVEETQTVKVSSSNVEKQDEKVKEELTSIRSKKMDEFYHAEDDNRPRRRGKHF